MIDSPRTTLRWGILSAAKIARKVCAAIQTAPGSELAAVASRDLAKAEAFAGEFDIPRSHGSYEALLADPGVDAVYIGTPHPLHARWAIAAAEAGKHVLCEKPIGVNAAQAMAIIEAARANDVVLMEAFMYRYHPVVVKLAELLREQAVGRVRLIEAGFAFQAGFDPDSRLFANDLAGGGILDVGCYPVSACRLLAGAALGKPSAVEPVKLAGTAHLGETGVDEWAAATLTFPDGILAQAVTGVRMTYPNGIRIVGEDGRIELRDPWWGNSPIEILKKGEEPRTIECEPGDYRFEVEAFARQVAEHAGSPTDGLAEPPPTLMTPEDTLGNMMALDKWRASAGLVYAGEQPGGAMVAPVHGRAFAPASRGGNDTIPTAPFPGLDKPVSQLVMGIDNQKDLPWLAVMLDDFIERGGNAIDTAWLYGRGHQESLVGDYLRSRPDIRDRLVITAKGAHTPFCQPDNVRAQLVQSLGRLQTGYADIYMMHRDNLEVPVDEFVDALNGIREEGLCTVFGVSNWTLARIGEFNTIAEKKGLAPIQVVSNNFSLARMVDPVWAGCEAASEPEFRQWLEATGTPLLAWSSQARGFFTERAGRDKTDDAELVRCWYADDNFERRDRAIALARARGVSPLNVALAYVLAQPFRLHALVGPRFLWETRTLLPGAHLPLDAATRAWLNLETDEAPEGI
ncbi:MAG: aldo/keto reductase [Opitutales bacterium]